MGKEIIRKASEIIREFYYSLLPDIEFLKKLENSPKCLAIEPINICNANCIFCAYQFQTRKKQRMDDWTLEKTIAEYIGIGGGNLYWAVVVGDPLLDPRCVERIRYVRSFAQINRIETVTNCLNLHKIGAQELLSSGLNIVNVSMTGFIPEMYERIYRNGNYDQMKANVLHLLRTNHELGKPVKIHIGLRIDQPLEKVLASPGFDEVMILADSVERNIFFDSWSGRIRNADLPGNMKIRPRLFGGPRRRIPCGQLWIGLGVLVDGTVTACSCRDLNGDSKLVLGSIGKKTLEELCFSPHLRKLREDWLEGRKIPDLCQDCRHYFPYTYLMLPEVKEKLNLS